MAGRDCGAEETIAFLILGRRCFLALTKEEISSTVASSLWPSERSGGRKQEPCVPTVYGLTLDTSN